MINKQDIFFLKSRYQEKIKKKKKKKKKGKKKRFGKLYTSELGEIEYSNNRVKKTRKWGHQTRDSRQVQGEYGMNEIWKSRSSTNKAKQSKAMPVQKECMVGNESENAIMMGDDE